VKVTGYENVSHFSRISSPKRINLRPTKTKMIRGPFYTMSLIFDYISPGRNASCCDIWLKGPHVAAATRPCTVYLFVCLFICFYLFTCLLTYLVSS